MLLLRTGHAGAGGGGEHAQEAVRVVGIVVGVVDELFLVHEVRLIALGKGRRPKPSVVDKEWEDDDDDGGGGGEVNSKEERLLVAKGHPSCWSRASATHPQNPLHPKLHLLLLRSPPRTKVDVEVGDDVVAHPPPPHVHEAPSNPRTTSSSVLRVFCAQHSSKKK